jgi:hypothetical protein
MIINVIALVACCQAGIVAINPQASLLLLQGARMFCSAFNFFCMQIWWDWQFYFIFMGEWQFYFIFSG